MGHYGTLLSSQLTTLVGAAQVTAGLVLLRAAALGGVQFVYSLG